MTLADAPRCRTEMPPSGQSVLATRPSPHLLGIRPAPRPALRDRRQSAKRSVSELCKPGHPAHCRRVPRGCRVIRCRQFDEGRPANRENNNGQQRETMKLRWSFAGLVEPVSFRHSPLPRSRNLANQQKENSDEFSASLPLRHARGGTAWGRRLGDRLRCRHPTQPGMLGTVALLHRLGLEYHKPNAIPRKLRIFE
jgi:hypothetical protein